MRIRGGKLIAGFVAVLAVVGLSAPMAAEASNRSAESVTKGVLLSSDPHAAYQALDSADKAKFSATFADQTYTETVTGGAYTPTPAELAAMTPASDTDTASAPNPDAPSPDASGLSAVQPNAAAVSGCWYKYYYRTWSDLGIQDGETWMQLNWCGSNGRITRWSQSNVGCSGHYGFSCKPKGTSSLNVTWEIRSTRYYEATFLAYTNQLCMQVRGGATGKYSARASNNSGCSLN